MQSAPGLGAQSCPQSARTAPLSAERLPSAERESSRWRTEDGIVLGGEACRRQDLDNV